jgi:ATP-binding cassette, subfamily F, member 3
MSVLQKWNGGVIIISHDERFITTVAKEVCSIQLLRHFLIVDISLLAMGLW